MNNEDGTKVTERNLFKYTLDHLADGLCFAYEMESPEGIAFCQMLDNTIKYGAAIFYGRDPKECEECAYERSNDNYNVVSIY